MKRIVFSFAVTLCAGWTLADDFGLNPAAGTDTVYFRSSAKLEFIEGKTTDIQGGFRFNPPNPRGELSGVLRVDLRTLKTGIETRDGHMRDRHLHTKDFPYAYFELLSASGFPDTIVVDSAYTIDVEGFFYIHGVKRRIAARLTASSRPPQSGSTAMKLDARFALRLDDFKIPRPKALFLKLAEVIEVEAVFTTLSTASIPVITLPDWPELH